MLKQKEFIENETVLNTGMTALLMECYHRKLMHLACPSSALPYGGELVKAGLAVTKKHKDYPRNKELCLTISDSGLRYIAEMKRKIRQTQ